MLDRFFYNIFLFAYSAGIRIASLWNPKAGQWISGRARQNISLPPASSKTVWMHCASLGEFEQGRPVIEALRNSNPGVRIVLTFFSPSGYEACKNYSGADYIFYLPMDNIFSAKKFIAAVNPSLVLWIKYEYWVYYLEELKKKGIPVLLVSGIFRKNQPFFKIYGGMWKKMLKSFTHLFVQNETSQKLLATIGFTENVSISGDTRFDRVTAIAQTTLNNEIITAFTNGKKVIVAGSTWEDDEIILSAYADETKNKFKLIVVPHELDKQHLDTVKRIFKQSVFYTAVEKDKSLLGQMDQYTVLIVDTMGLLSRLYSIAYINYVGGGFTSDGIHNILEAAVWGKPVIIGENYEKYFEASDLVECGAAESISDTNELKEVIEDWRTDENYYSESAAAAKKYVYENAGATKKIQDYIYVNRLLIN